MTTALYILAGITAAAWAAQLRTIAKLAIIVLRGR